MAKTRVIAAVLAAAFVIGAALPVQLSAGQNSEESSERIRSERWSGHKGESLGDSETHILRDFNVLSYLADYTQINMITYNGKPVVLSIEGNSLHLSCDGCSSSSLTVVNYNTGWTVDEASGTTSVAIDLTGDLEYLDLCYVKAKFTIDNIEQVQTDILITSDDKGSLRFVKSPIYDFNVERCSECWTDDQSLAECLEPMNDIECDAPEVIRIAEEITAGMTDDWSKSFAIYDYVIHTFAYDYVQLDDVDHVYQDDAVTLLRRKIAICEGIANVYVALCRAVGVPATVSYGIGEDVQQVLNNRNLQTYNEWPNHAWAMVCLGGEWYNVDPTWDDFNQFIGDSIETGRRIDDDPTYDYYLVPVEIFSFSHKICDADTRHGIETSGNAGESARYEISRDGVMTVFGSGKLEIPEFVNGYWKVVFDESSTITAIGEKCFVDRDLLTVVILPDTVTELCHGAFNTCEDLEYIYLPEGLQIIGSECFDFCDELAYVYVPDSVTEIGEWAFDDCPRLVISIPARFSGFDYDNYVKCLEIIERQ
ncbi:MAG: leucine-rich repeat protein [Clostridiales bacterium]|nr:leucine-rich repeat protein [Clostridiales bacterium]